jgi:hypothetical protein
VDAVRSAIQATSGQAAEMAAAIEDLFGRAEELSDQVRAFVGSIRAAA